MAGTFHYGGMIKVANQVKARNMMFDPDCECGDFHMIPREIFPDGSTLTIIGNCVGCNRFLTMEFDFNGVYGNKEKIKS